MKVGTKSVLFGAHCFILHPWFVAAAWWKLYGFPSDPRLWAAFLVHDLGYWGKPNMDGPEGERHPYLGSRIMWFLFEREAWDGHWLWGRITAFCNRRWKYQPQGMRWDNFCLFHSRYLAKSIGHPFSRLCVADKLAIALTPVWLYLPMATATGEIREYLKNAQKASDGSRWKPTGNDAKVWHKQLCEYMRNWVAEHKDGRQDTWTSSNRNARSASGV